MSGMPPSLSRRTLEILAEMNWSETRAGCAALMESALVGLGHVMSPPVTDFLDRFGYLRQLRQSPYHSEVVAFHTNAAEAGSRIDSGELSEIAAGLGARLCPVGEAGYGFYVLLMDEFERTFALDEYGDLTKWADSGEELIERLCTVASVDPVDDGIIRRGSGEGNAGGETG